MGDLFSSLWNNSEFREVWKQDLGQAVCLQNSRTKKQFIQVTKWENSQFVFRKWITFGIVTNVPRVVPVAGCRKHCPVPFKVMHKNSYVVVIYVLLIRCQMCLSLIHMLNVWTSAGYRIFQRGGGGGCANPRGSATTYFLAIFLPKAAWKWKKLD